MYTIRKQTCRTNKKANKQWHRESESEAEVQAKIDEEKRKSRSLPEYQCSLATWSGLDWCRKRGGYFSVSEDLTLSSLKGKVRFLVLVGFVYVFCICFSFSFFVCTCMSFCGCCCLIIIAYFDRFGKNVYADGGRGKK